MSCDNMDRFLQRMRSDLMFELRKIEHGERPVTGQNHRENLQHFFEKNLMSNSSDTVAGKANISSNHDNIETHRPEAIVVEVQGIIERRPVSSILESAAFRRQLENIIRGSIQSTRPNITRGSVLNQPLRNTSTLVSASLVSQEVRQELQTLSRSASIESLDSFASAVSSVEDDFNDEDGQPTPSLQSQANNSPTVLGMADNLHDQSRLPGLGPIEEPRLEPRAEARLEPIIEPRPVHRTDHRPEARLEPILELQHEVQQERIGWNELNIRQRDELVEEISDLLHSRLVSSALNGEFRATLELQVQERIRTAGVDGRAVEDFVRSLPRTGVPRNDFSHLGINQGVEADNWENISVTSVSAHSVPYVQTNAYLGREIQGLKAQLNEMKNMLKLTFDLQLDIQKAIRQEVAAAMNSMSASPPLPSHPINDTHCLICLDRHTDTVLYQCGHMCVCYACGIDLVNRGHKCPVCRAPIKDIIRAYKTNAE